MSDVPPRGRLLPRADPSFLSAQQRSSESHPWFQVQKLDARSHFPTLEAPEPSAPCIGKLAFVNHRGALTAFSFVLLGLTSYAVYANVFSEDRDLVVRARQMAQQAACGGSTCLPLRVRIERGMITQTFDYDFDRAGQVTVECRRKAIVFGAYSCAHVPSAP